MGTEATESGVCPIIGLELYPKYLSERKAKTYIICDRYIQGTYNKSTHSVNEVTVTTSFNGLLESNGVKPLIVTR